MPTALITGITGQDGLYLAELLHSEGYAVHGLVRGEPHPREGLLRELVPDVVLHRGDVTDPQAVARAVQAAEPDEVYHLAAASSVAASWDDVATTTGAITRGAVAVLDAVHAYAARGGRVRLLHASSAEVFGAAVVAPQDEHTRLAPRSPYGAAKAFAQSLTEAFREQHGLHAASAVLYNHESPRRGADFVTRKISRGVARIAIGLDDRLTLGDLDARRDWGFAGDHVRAMWLMLQQDEPEDLVVATGTTHSVRDLVDAAFARAGIDDPAAYVRQDPALVRPPERHLVVGDASRAREKLGWAPTVGFEELVAMMVDADLAAERAALAGG